MRTAQNLKVTLIDLLLKLTLLALHQVFRPIELIYVGGPAKHQFLVPLQFDLKKYRNHILIGI